MSSTGGHLKAARSLREAESLLLRKQILKSNSLQSTEGSESDLFQKIADSGQIYLDKLATLNKFKSRSKTKTKNISLQSDWILEQNELQKMSSGVEIDLRGILEVLVLHSNSSRTKSEDVENETYRLEFKLGLEFCIKTQD
jgi:hypothetical protein